MINIIIFTFIVGVVGTGLGGMIGSLFKKESNRLMSLLLNFAAGIMLSIVCFDLIPSSIESGGVYVTVFITGFGAIIIYFLNSVIENITQKERKFIKKTNNKEKRHLSISEASKLELLRAGLVMVLAIALHNLPEGISIGSSYAYDFETGIVLAILIAFHNIPEGMAISVPLIIGGMKKPKAVFITSLSGAPTIIGAILGFWLGELNAIGLTISLSLASGAMIYIVFGEVLPQSILIYRSKEPAFLGIIGFLLGLILISFL